MRGLMVKCLTRYSNNILVTFKLIHKIKATPGITGLILWIAHINIVVLHLDVGLSFPNEK